MSLRLPSTLSPSKMAGFTDCALAFRLTNIDRVPEPPAEHLSKGSLVHAALERLMDLPPERRTLPTALACLDAAALAFRSDPDFTGLHLTDDEETAFYVEAETLVRNYFLLEDPTKVHPIGLELRLQIVIDGLRLRGVIDRLELDEDGELIVVDYKTGKAPKAEYDSTRLGGVKFYALLCERLFGRRPAKVRLMYLGGDDPVTVTSTPTGQSTRGFEKKIAAMWKAIVRACERESFNPRPSPLCDWCSYKPWCPAHGGDPTPLFQAVEPAVETPVEVRALASV